jgi:hypothetical protein
MRNNPEEITNKNVKKIFRNKAFFINVDKLVQVLKPIKTAITLLESVNTNLADCFLQLILLANAIKKLPYERFRQYSIGTFNKYWDKFDPDIYILSYFLHPGFRD